MPESGGTGPREAEVLLYQTEDGRARVEVRFEGETAWVTQAALGDLFQTTSQNIGQQIAAIYSEGELEEAATCKRCFQVQSEGSRQVRRGLRWSLPMIIAVGYRVRSGRGTQFRQWAITMDDVRLKNPPGLACRTTSTSCSRVFGTFGRRRRSSGARCWRSTPPASKSPGSGRPAADKWE